MEEITLKTKNNVEQDGGSRRVQQTVRRCSVNHTKWPTVIAGLDRNTLRDICKTCNIILDKSNRNSRERMAHLICQRIDLSKRVILEINLTA